MNYEVKLEELGITLPQAMAPAANYIPFIQSGNMVYVSGQVSTDGEGFLRGRLGENMDEAAGAIAARSCGISLIAQLKAACGGDLSRLKQVIKLTGFVNSAPGFTAQPAVINGCSDLMVAVFGDAGRHARSAVGVADLPMGVAVEIEGIFEVI